MSGDLVAGRVVAIGGEPGPAVRLGPGPLAPAVVVSGIPLGDLPAGTRLRLGREVVVELAGDVEAAAERGPSGGGLREEGVAEPVATRVLAEGEIRVGDAVAVEAVTLAIQDALDLHPFAPAETADVVREYLTLAQAAHLTEVRIVHGRGRGVQRQIVRGVLAASPLVAAFGDAPPERGGWGATLVRLRRDGGTGPA
jgi:hypothetical protein